MPILLASPVAAPGGHSRSFQGRMRTASLRRIWPGGMTAYTDARAFYGSMTTADAFVNLRIWSGTMQTADLKPPPVTAPPSGAQPGDVVIPPQPRFTVSFDGFGDWDALNFTYSASSGNQRPTLQLTTLGKIDFAGSLSITVTAIPGYSGDSYGETYGPVRTLSSTQSQKPTGFQTSFETADTTAADTMASQVQMPELVAWEKDRQLTPEQTAEKAREEAVKQQALSKLPCPDKKDALRDGRSMSVLELLNSVAGYLGIPYHWVKPYPLPAARIYADEYVTLADGRTIKASSLSTKGQTAIAFLQSELGRINWTVTLKAGVAALGPVADTELIPAGGAAAFLGVEANLLTEFSRKIAQQGTGITSSPDGSTGDYSLPYMATVTAAPIHHALEPLLPETKTPEENFADNPNGSYATSSEVHRADGKLESSTQGTVVKAGGVVTLEYSSTEGLEPLPRNGLLGDPGPAQDADLPKGQHRPETWGLISTRQVNHFYDNALFPQTETGSVSVTTSYDPDLDYMITSEYTEVRKVYLDTGYLASQIESTTKYDGINEVDPPEGDTGGNFGVDPDTGKIKLPVFSYEATEQAWVEIGGGKWLHTTLSRSLRFLPRYQDGVLSDTDAKLIPTASSEITGPPDKATAQDAATPCPTDSPEGQAFEYDSPNQKVFYTRGRGAAVNIDIPYIVDIPDWLAPLLLAAQLERNEVTYTLPIPINPPVGGVVKTLTVTGKGAGSVSSQVTLLEATS